VNRAGAPPSRPARRRARWSFQPGHPGCLAIARRQGRGSWACGQPGRRNGKSRPGPRCRAARRASWRWRCATLQAARTRARGVRRRRVSRPRRRRPGGRRG